MKLLTDKNKDRNKIVLKGVRKKNSCIYRKIDLFEALTEVIKTRKEYDYSLINLDVLKGHGVGGIVLNLICPKHGKFTIGSYQYVIQNGGCRKCFNENKAPKPKIPLAVILERFAKYHGDRYDYSRVILGRNLKSKVEIVCKKHGAFLQSPEKHASGRNCPKCSGKYHWTTEEWIERAKSIHGDRYDYSKTKYVGKKTKVIIVCKQHGEFTQTPDDHVNSKAGCPMCNMSSGEEIIADLLDTYGINYKFQYKVDGYNFRYDFYLVDVNLLVEYNGIQHYHYTPVFHRNPKYGFDYYRSNDRAKRKLANSIGIPLLVLPYTIPNGLLKMILVNKLSSYYRYYKYGKFYKTFLDFCKCNKLPKSTTLNDVKEFLLVKQLHTK